MAVNPFGGRVQFPDAASRSITQLLRLNNAVEREHVSFVISFHANDGNTGRIVVGKEDLTGDNATALDYILPGGWLTIREIALSTDGLWIRGPAGDVVYVMGMEA